MSRASRAPGADSLLREAIEKKAGVAGGQESRPVLGREMPTEIGAIIYSRRKNLHWCRHTLAERSSVGRYQIKAIEEGRGWPKPDCLRRILDCISAAEREAHLGPLNPSVWPAGPEPESF